ncbi:MAG: hypothetical protein ACKPKO_43075, partial [Candidatus Fonsibacter sp.]
LVCCGLLALLMARGGKLLSAKGFSTGVELVAAASFGATPGGGSSQVVVAPVAAAIRSLWVEDSVEPVDDGGRLHEHTAVVVASLRAQ